MKAFFSWEINFFDGLEEKVFFSPKEGKHKLSGLKKSQECLIFILFVDPYSKFYAIMLSGIVYIHTLLIDKLLGGKTQYLL